MAAETLTVSNLNSCGFKKIKIKIQFIIDYYYYYYDNVGSVSNCVHLTSLQCVYLRVEDIGGGVVHGDALEGGQHAHLALLYRHICRQS